MKSGNFVTTNTYFSSFYVFTTLHGLHLLGGLFFWGKVSSRVLKLEHSKILDQEKKKHYSFILVLDFFINSLVSIFFNDLYFNDAFIEWCKSIIA